MSSIATAQSGEPTPWIIAEAMSGEVVVNIGQVNKPTARALDNLVKAGTLLKWRGKWYPVAGAAWGLGPDKMCWGLTSKFGAAS